MFRARLVGWLARLGVVSAGGLAISCTHVSGEVRAVGGPDGDWALRPNRCKAGEPNIAWGGSDVVAVAGRTADLYYAGENAADTEVVVSGERSRAVLVRIPGKGKMVVLRQADCAVLDVSTDHTSYSVNHEVGLVGHVRFDCQRPEIGRVTGEVSFTCF